MFRRSWRCGRRRRKDVAKLAGVSLPTVDRWVGRFAEKVADIVGLYLDPPGEAVVRAVDEKTLDRTQPLLPLGFGVTEKRTHDYKRHGTTNLFAALDVASGRVVADCAPRRDGAAFLAFLRKVVRPYAGGEIHMMLDNLSTHTTPEVKAWLEKNPHVTFHFTPVNALITRIREYVAHWNTQPKPFTWTAATNDILAKVRWVETNVKQRVDNNAK